MPCDHLTVQQIDLRLQAWQPAYGVIDIGLQDRIMKAYARGRLGCEVVPVVLKYADIFDQSAFVSAVREVAARNPIFQLRCRVDSDTLLVRFAREDPSIVVREATADEFDAVTVAPFCLDNEPPMRLVTCPEGRRLALTFDHTSVDHFGLRSFLRQLDVQLQGGPPPQQQSWTPWDFAQQQEAWLRDHLNDELAFWRNYLQGMSLYPDARLPETSGRRVVHAALVASRQSTEVPRDAAIDFLAGCRRARITSFAGLLSALFTAVSEASRSAERIGVVTHSAARSSTELDAVACLTNRITVVSPVAPSGSSPLLETHEMVRVATRHDRVPRCLVEDALVPDVDALLRCHTFIQFNWHNARPSVVRLGPHQFQECEEPPQVGAGRKSRPGLHLTAVTTSASINLNAWFATDEASSEIMNDVLQRWVAAITALAKA
jgi:hypothetical protein